MSTHNIGFYEDLTKIIFELSSNTHLISSSEKKTKNHAQILVIYFHIYFHDLDMCTTELDNARPMYSMSIWTFRLDIHFHNYTFLGKNRKNKSLTKITWFTVRDFATLKKLSI